MSHDAVIIGAFQLDLSAHQALRGDQRVGLTRNEVALLRYLLQRPGEAVPRHELHTQVFGYAPQVVSRAADFAVHRLRKKLETAPSAPQHLLTVPGVGFRLVLGSAPEAAGPEATEAPRHNLPADTTRFLGREQELEELLALLDGGGRLVTLVGPGGVGKTRLARRVGAAWFEDQGAAVRFCDLTMVRSEPALLGAVATAVGFEGKLSGGDHQRLAGLLAAAPMLLILDNVEQLLAPVAAAAVAWLEAAPNLRLLLTSRERTRAAGEHIYELHPLDDADGVALFIDRARMARPSFELQDQAELETVTLLARQLDGLPLAIELAAARSPVLSPGQMLERLNRPAGVERSPRGVPGRQATLERAIRWSWDLLSAEDRSALCQLTAFKAAFDIDDAEAVLALGEAAGSVVERVQALREKSMLVEVAEVGPPRFTMLTSVRAFAEDQSEAPLALWGRHAAWVVARTRAPCRQRLLGDTQRDLGLVRLHADLAAAIERLGGVNTSPQLFAEAVTAAHATWERAGDRADYVARVHQALEAEQLLSVDARVGLHLALAYVLQERGGGEAAVASCRQVLALVPEQASAEAAAAHLLLASFHLWARRVDETWAELHAARACLTGLQASALHVKLELQVGNVRLQQRRYGEVDRQFYRAMAQCERAGLPSFEPLILLNHAVLRGWEFRRREQVVVAREALICARANRNRKVERRALLMLAVSQVGLGEFDDAFRHGVDAVRRGEADHDPTLLGRALVTLASIDFAREDFESVQRHVRQARQMEDRIPAPQDLAYVDLWDAVSCWARWGAVEEAAGLLRRAATRAGDAFYFGSVVIQSKLLAVRAHLEPDAEPELQRAAEALEEQARGLDSADALNSLAIDRAHFSLARARQAAARGEDPTPLLAPVRSALRGGVVWDADADGLTSAHARALLAAVFAQLPELSRDQSVASEEARG